MSGSTITTPSAYDLLDQLGPRFAVRTAAELRAKLVLLRQDELRLFTYAVRPRHSEARRRRLCRKHEQLELLVRELEKIAAVCAGRM